MPNQPAYAEATQHWPDAFLALGGMHVLPLGIRAALLLARMHETATLRNFVFANPRQTSNKTPADLQKAG